MITQTRSYDVRRGCHAPTKASHVPTYSFTIIERLSACIIWAGAGFVSEKNRDHAVNVALRVLKEKA